MPKTVPLSHCAREVRAHNRDRFMQSLFVPPEYREQLLALYALEVELTTIHKAVSEEMIAHIRYAWWQEAIEGLYAGHVPRGHPVLEALVPVIAHIPQEKLLAVVILYREHFPQLPSHENKAMQEAAATLVNSLCPQAQKRWQRAGEIIRHHRARHLGGNGWLALKLLLSGL